MNRISIFLVFFFVYFCFLPTIIFKKHYMYSLSPNFCIDYMYIYTHQIWLNIHSAWHNIVNLFCILGGIKNISTIFTFHRLKIYCWILPLSLSLSLSLSTQQENKNLKQIHLICVFFLI